MKHERQKCGDCGCLEGELHKAGCDHERCPFCEGQLLSCSCSYKYLGFNYVSQLLPYPPYVDESNPYCGLPKDIYENGLPEDLINLWEEILERKGRVTFVLYPNKCSKCGELWPEMFKVDDEEWKKYVHADKRDTVICKTCYDNIKKWTDEVEEIS